MTYRFPHRMVVTFRIGAAALVLIGVGVALLPEMPHFPANLAAAAPFLALAAFAYLCASYYAGYSVVIGNGFIEYGSRKPQRAALSDVNFLRLDAGRGSKYLFVTLKSGKIFGLNSWLDNFEDLLLLMESRTGLKVLKAI